MALHQATTPKTGRDAGDLNADQEKKGDWGASLRRKGNQPSKEGGGGGESGTGRTLTGLKAVRESLEKQIQRFLETFTSIDKEKRGGRHRIPGKKKEEEFLVRRLNF